MLSIDTSVLPQADSLIVDLYMGSGNPLAGFRWTIGGLWNTLLNNQAGDTGLQGVSFNFGPLDDLARGLHNAGVWALPHADRTWQSWLC